MAGDKSGNNLKSDGRLLKQPEVDQVCLLIRISMISRSVNNGILINLMTLICARVHIS